MMSYIDLASCWGEQRGVGGWRLLGEFNWFPPPSLLYAIPPLRTSFPSISSMILAPTSLVIPKLVTYTLGALVTYRCTIDDPKR